MAGSVYIMVGKNVPPMGMHRTSALPVSHPSSGEKSMCHNPGVVSSRSVGTGSAVSDSAEPNTGDATMSVGVVPPVT